MPKRDQRLLPAERSAVMGLAGILALRMLGYYAVLPILSAYAESLPGARSMWIGMTVGIYGLTQAVFQVPFGLLSDRFGRRISIVVGLLVFSIGSFVAGWAQSIWMLLIGRLIQGAGAVASVLIALAADLTRPSARTRAMAFLGLSIGASFGIGFVVGPPAAAQVGVPFLFHLTGVLSLLSAIWVGFFLPRPETPPTHERDLTLEKSVEVLRRRELFILNLGTFVIHLSLTCLFVVVPIQLEAFLSWDQLWLLYLPTVGTSLTVMYLAARRADHPGWARPILWMGAGLLALGCAVLGIFPVDRLATHVVGIFLFTLGIALAEPVLPALLTRFAPAGMRGTSAGVFNVFQFMGAFIGGLMGGGSLALGPQRLFLVLAVLLLAWTIYAIRIPNPFRVEIARRRQEKRDAGGYRSPRQGQDPSSGTV